MIFSSAKTTQVTPYRKMPLSNALLTLAISLFLLATSKVHAQIEAPNSALITKYKLLNPTQLQAAKAQAAKISADANSLRAKAAVQMKTKDFQSATTGRVSSAEHIRKQGEENLKIADTMEAEANALLQEIARVNEYYTSIAAQFPETYDEIMGTNGAVMEAKIIGVFDNLIVAKRRNGDFVGISFQFIHPSKTKAVAGRIMELSLQRLASNLTAVELPENINLNGSQFIAESEFGLVIKDKQGRIQLAPVNSTPSTPKTSYRAILENTLKQYRSDLSELEKESENVSKILKEQRRKLNKIYGEQETFVVDTMLSLDDFPALKNYGQNLYQVKIKGETALLVTQQKKYLARNEGTLLVKDGGIYEVMMPNGQRKNLPCLIESDQNALRKLENIDNQLAASEACIAPYIKEAKNGCLSIEKVLATLKSNNQAIWKIESQIRSALSNTPK